MEESILTSIKIYLGVTKDQTAFDQEIMMDINTVFATLFQIGAEPVEGFSLEGPDETWSDAFPNFSSNLVALIKQYTRMKVQIIFDPPSSSFVMESLNRQIAEFEWRINIEAEGGFDLDE